jgi:hypothetical protein
MLMVVVPATYGGAFRYLMMKRAGRAQGSGRAGKKLKCRMLVYMRAK